MAVRNMLNLKGDEIEELLHRAIAYSPPKWVPKDDNTRRLEVLGYVFQNGPLLEAKAIQVAAGRLGCRTADLGWDDAQRMSTESLQREVNMFSKAVDALLTAFVDIDTFGAGRRLVEQLGTVSRVPLVNLSDDIYATQSALAVTSALWERLGGLEGKNIAISWGFGSTHALPSTAHSLCLIGASLGAHIRVVSPSDFSLLNRVLRSTRDRAKTAGGTLEEHHDFNSFEDVDAVYAMNWCRLDDFNRPERNSEYASKYRDWHFTKDELPKRALFVTCPPIQTELLAGRRLVESENNLTPDLFAWTVQALLASISFVVDEKTKHSVLL
jgi:ornithine carbamoyltransferase